MRRRTVVKELLVDLRDRGVDVKRPVLVVIDGAKAPATAVNAVFDHPVIKRCQLHRIRIVEAKLSQSMAATVAKEMLAAYHDPGPLAAEAAIEAFARSLDVAHPGAAGSLREGLAETPTVSRLGVPPPRCSHVAVNERDRVDRDLPRPQHEREAVV